MRLKLLIAVFVAILFVVSFSEKSYGFGEHTCVNGGQTLKDLRACLATQKYVHDMMSSADKKMQSDLDKSRIDLKNLQVKYSADDSRNWALAKTSLSIEMQNNENTRQEMIRQQNDFETHKMWQEFAYWQKYGGSHGLSISSLKVVSDTGTIPSYSVNSYRLHLTDSASLTDKLKP